MPTSTDLKIAAAHLCAPLDDTTWYDLTSGIRARLSLPLLLADGTVELQAPLPPDGRAPLDRLEAMLSARFHGEGGRLHFRVAEPADHIVSAEMFVEGLLDAAGRVDGALRDLTAVETGTAWSPHTEEALLAIIDGIRDGKVDHAALARRFAEPEFAPGTSVHYQLFARNGHILVEQLRTALLRAFGHADRMVGGARSLLRNEGNRYFQPLARGEEIVHSSPTAEHLHGAFSDGIGAIATALDLLYRVFVYLVREPFGSAELPGKLHFPYNEFGRAYTPFPAGTGVDATDLGPGDLPHALPNLAPGSFFALRAMRNDLTHNMMSGHIQPSCFIGLGTDLVAGIPIHYVQAVAPDVDAAGRPLKHPYVERFFHQQRDAAVLLRDLLEELALAADHTLLWLADRLEQRLARATPQASA